jgi:hypothetical protein
MSNCKIREKKLEFAWHIPFREMAGRNKSVDSSRSKEMSRDVEALVASLYGVFLGSPEFLQPICIEE